MYPLTAQLLDDLKKPEEVAPTPDLKDLRVKLKEYEPVIDKALKTYAGGAGSPVLRDRARIMAAQALRTYDPKYGASVSTHLMRQLQRLQREAPTISDPLPIPERFRRDQASVAQALADFEDENGVAAEPEDVAERLKLPLKRVRKVMTRMKARVPWSTYEEADDDEDDQADVAVTERTPWDEWVDAVYNDLSPRDRAIMRHRAGYGGSPVLGNVEIAEKLGISPQIVSQRARLIQAKLDRFQSQ